MLQYMKLSVGNLRKIIREILAEETKFPGGAFGGGKLSPEDEERLAYQGFLGVMETDELSEVSDEDETG